MDDAEPESMERRLAAVERALSDGEPIDRRERLDELEARIAELEAAVEALRGYVGSVRAVNDDVEHRADLALRKATALERHVGGGADGYVSDTGVEDDPDEETVTDPEGTDDDHSGVGFGNLRDAL